MPDMNNLYEIPGEEDSTTGTVTSVSGTSPVASTGGTDPVISMAAATNASAGHATATHIQALEAATAAQHARQHAITSTSDHTSSATPGQVLKADANGLPVDIGVQTANTVFSGPATGAAANPTFRALVNADVPMKKPYHGIESIGALSFNNSSHVLTIATGVTYWIAGAQKVNSGATTCDIDDYKSITARTLYWFYFDDTSGTLKCDTTCNLRTQAPVATVYWNGSAGAIQKEYHSHTRDIDWHIWAHDTIGTRYENNGGFTQTAPTTAADETLNIGVGTIFDEDLEITTSGAQTTMRGWYMAASNSYTFADYSLPYLGISGHCYWLDTDDYTLKDVDHSKYVCYWVYASLDVDRPLYVIPTHAADPHNTIALARVETAPSLVGLGINAEIKLIYKWIYRGDAQYQEGVDYRTSSVLPGGGITAVSAASVSSLAHGDVSSTNVQDAIAELADEKLSLSGGTMSGNIIMPDGGTIGQAAGPLVAFDDTNNYLEITGCNVGIGATAPATKLHVYSTTTNADIYAQSTHTGSYAGFMAGCGQTFYNLTFGSAATGTTFGLNRTSSTYIYVDGGNYFGVGTTGSTPLILATNQLERLRIDTSGNIGIGTTGQLSKLCINGGLHVGGDSDAGDNNLLVDGTGTITGGFGCNAKTAQTSYASGGALAAYAAGTNGLDSGANMSALHAMVVSIRAALVANGIMS